MVGNVFDIGRELVSRSQTNKTRGLFFALRRSKYIALHTFEALAV